MATLVSKLNSILKEFAKQHDAELITIDKLEWKDLPESLRLKKYEGTDWDPLHQTAKILDLTIISASVDELSTVPVEQYIYQARNWFLEYSKDPKNETLGSCTCGGTLKMRQVKATGMGFYSCSNWQRGCKETRNLLGESTSLGKKLVAKEVGRACPTCRKGLVIRTAKVGKMAGKEFVGCSGFPSCKYTEKM